MSTMPSPPAVIVVLIPALNEEQSIELVLKSVSRTLVCRTVVIDNGSSDRTSEIAARSGAQVVLEPQRGYGSACLTGIKALPADTEIVVFLDADYSDFPEEIEALVRPILEHRADLVIGTRMHSQARAALTLQQRWGNWLAVHFMRHFWSCNYTDLGPFRAVRRSSLEMLSMSDRNFGWTVEMQIKAVLCGLRVLEVPVRYRLRIGKSKVSGTIKGVILAGSKILYTIFRYAWLTRRPRELCKEVL
jgi:glycosyltransferase involved in cell wall biosynthesis